MSEDNIEEHKRVIAIKIIECLDELYDLKGDISITTTHHNNPKYFDINISDKHNNKIGINIHKLK